MAGMDLSYYHSISTRPLVNSTYWHILDKHCDTHPNKEAVIIYQDKVCIYRATFKQLRDSTETNTGILLHRYPELRCGDRIGIVGSNRPEVFLAELMAYRLGLSAVFPPAGPKNSEDLISTLNITDCKALVFDTDFIGKDEIGMVLKSVSSIKFALNFGDNAFDVIENDVLRWDGFFKTVIATEKDRIKAKQYCEDVHPDMEAAIYFTSESTGLPKGLVHSHFNIVNNQLISGNINNWDHTTIYCQDRPISVAAGAYFSTRLTSLCGGTCVIFKQSEGIEKVDTSTIASIIQKEKVNQILLFGYMIHDFMSSSDSIRNKLLTLEMATLSGEMHNMQQLELFQHQFPNLQLRALYGSSEMNAVICQEDTTSPGFIGKALHHFETKIADENGKTVPFGSPGELYIRSPMAFLCYLTPEGQMSGKDSAGWYHTNDSATMNEKGEIKILGRISDVIKRAGRLIFPFVIETVIGQHPLVQEVQVVGVSDARLNQDICACIITTGSTLTEDQIRSWTENKCKAGRYGKDLEPTYYIFMKEFPLAQSKKIDRKRLKDVAENTLLINKTL